MVEEAVTGNTGHFGPQEVSPFILGVAVDRKSKEVSLPFPYPSS